MVSGKRTLRFLVALQDLDLMIREAADPESKGEEENLGFKLRNLETLQTARGKLAEETGAKWLGLYERVSRRYGRAVVPVQGRVCLGCFMTLPTSVVPRKLEDSEITLCENCGRILYWL
ncbi:MAG: C4-type zinc ribbon domain-containing protein [Candidatus Eisenbacteria bacterium]